MAVENNNLEALKFLINNKYEIDSVDSVHCSAAKHGNIDMFKYLLSQNIQMSLNYHAFSSDGLSVAISNDRFDYIKYLFANCNIRTTQDSYCSCAAQRNNFKILKYLHEKGMKSSYQTAEYAAKSNNIEMLKYLIENDCNWSVGCYVQAAYNANLEMIKYLHNKQKQFPKCTKMTMICSKIIYSKEGSLDCLKYFNKNGIKYFSDTCNLVIRGNNLKALKYLHKNGCKLTSGMAQTAFDRGYYQCLKYLLDNDCEWSFATEVVQNDAKFKCLEMIFEFAKTRRT